MYRYIINTQKHVEWNIFKTKMTALCTYCFVAVHAFKHCMSLSSSLSLTQQVNNFSVPQFPYI